MMYLIMQAVPDIPLIDKAISIGILMLFAFFFWKKIESVESKRDEDLKKFEELTRQMNDKYTDIMEDTIKENTKAISENTMVIEKLLKDGK